MSISPGNLTTLKAIIVDDEKRSHELIRSMLSDLPFTVNVIGSGYSIREGATIIQELQPDLIFLDIELSDGLGFDLLQNHQLPNLWVIFISAHAGYAIQAVKFGGLDYLLKPFSQNDLYKAVAAVFQKKKEEQDKQLEITMEAFRKLQTKELPSKFSITTTDGIIYKKIEDIIHLEANKNYTAFTFFGEKKKLLVSVNLGEYEEQFAPYPYLMRVHRSHLINLKFVERFLRNDGFSVVMEDGSQVPVSKKYRDDLLERLDQV
ncbi:MAG: LytTR family DNA-binding domain-containing protein [Saprospiraceae bacterium]|nr:response regulator transcription factor [Lewinella sp.]